MKYENTFGFRALLFKDNTNMMEMKENKPVPILIILIWCLHAHRQTWLFIFLYTLTNTGIPVSDYCILFAQAPSVFSTVTWIAPSYVQGKQRPVRRHFNTFSHLNFQLYVILSLLKDKTQFLCHSRSQALFLPRLFFLYCLLCCGRMHVYLCECLCVFILRFHMKQRK